MGGQHEAGAQVLGFGNRIQPLPGIGGNGLWRWCQQIGVRLVMRPAHATPKLVQLRQAKFVCPFNNNGVGAGDVDAGFHNSGAHQYVETLVVEIRHDLFQLALAHLTMRHTHPRLGNQLAQIFRGFLDGGDIVVQEIDLTAPQNFPQNSFFHHGLVVLAHKGFHRQPAGWWGRDNG